MPRVSAMSYKRYIIPLIFLSLLILSCGVGKKSATKTDLHFYYLELCPGCEEYEEADRMASEVRELGGEAFNLIGDEEAAAMKKLLEERGLSDIAHALPLLIQGESYLVGYEDIDREIRRLTE